MAADPARLKIPALLACAALAACTQNDGSLFNPLKDMTTVSEDEEREIGLEFDREIRKHVVVIDDPVVSGFINDLGQQIVRTIEPQPFIYRFRVIQDPSLNAFAVPGGYIYFHSGTVLSAGSIDELAGVMGHEIAHVSRHHYKRMKERSQIPDLLVGLAGMAAAVATEEPGMLVATQAANVAVKLKFSREFETESDQYGSIFMTRAGYDPVAITYFFERILHEQKRHPHSVPPYLFSHPDVEDRIETVRLQAATLRPTGEPEHRLDGELRESQARIAYLLDHRRRSLPPPKPPDDPHRVDPLLARANDLSQEGRVDEALIVLSRAENLEPTDPRVPFQIAELLAARGRHEQAVAAYRRTIRLDPTRGLVYYRLGLSHKAMGERHSAVAAFEQASSRAGETSALREKAEWQIETLIFPVFLEVGLADGVEAPGRETPLGAQRDAFTPDVRRVAWWARLSRRYGGYPDRMTLLWIDPEGTLVAETPVGRYRGGYIGALLELPAPGAAMTGRWKVEARYEGVVVDRRTFVVGPPSARQAPRAPPAHPARSGGTKPQLLR